MYEGRDLMEVLGCSVQEIADAKDFIKTITDCKVPVDRVKGSTKWLLAHQDDGVIWGYRDNDIWKLSSEAFPNISPKLNMERIQQLRIFGIEEEFLFWRDSKTVKCRVVDGGHKANIPEWAASFEESFIILGDRVVESTRDGFTVIGNAQGSRQAIVFFP